MSGASIIVLVKFIIFNLCEGLGDGGGGGGGCQPCIICRVLTPLPLVVHTRHR